MIGGAFVVLEKMKSRGGYLGTALNRVTWRNKIENGESLKMVINKELSLSGVQYPLSEKELEGFELIWAYGDFRAYIWVKEF
jgi:tRNA (cmo5U34)-methyltransferase